MTQIKIDTDIPPPLDNGRKRKYPFPSMKINQSIFLPGLEGEKLRNAANQYKTKHKDWNYVMRQENGGIRLWRVAPDNKSKGETST